MIGKKERILFKINAEAQKLAKMTRIAKGSINKVTIVRSGWQAHILTFKENNITKTVYIRKNKVSEVERLIKNYKKAKRIIESIITLNIQLLKLDK